MLCWLFLALWALALSVSASSESVDKRPYVMGVIGFGTKSHVNVFLRVEEELGRRGFRTSVAATSGHLHWMDGYNIDEVIDIGAAGLVSPRTPPPALSVVYVSYYVLLAG